MADSRQKKGPGCRAIGYDAGDGAARGSDQWVVTASRARTLTHGIHKWNMLHASRRIHAHYPSGNALCESGWLVGYFRCLSVCQYWLASSVPFNFALGLKILVKCCRWCILLEVYHGSIFRLLSCAVFWTADADMHAPLSEICWSLSKEQRPYTAPFQGLTVAVDME